MHIVLFTHPTFFNSKSMPKYAGMLIDGMKRRGHTVQVSTARAIFFNLPFPAVFKKWLGYLDQFVLFPLTLKRQFAKMPSDTIYVFSDQALGPWMPYFVNHPHVVHCHDFLAQRSAKGEIQENKVGITGRIYQSFIRRGYRKASNFISISEKTRMDLHLFLEKEPRFSRVVYNGLNQEFKFGDLQKARLDLQEEMEISLTSGYILHVGGNQFYKNRKGVIEIFSEWKSVSGSPLPLLLVGSSPTEDLRQAKNNSEFSSDIHFLTEVSDSSLQRAYHGATLLLYTSLDEGFGWPIAEAMASGCPVVAIDKAPMNEVGGKNCFYLPEPPRERSNSFIWLKKAAEIVDHVCKLPMDEREEFVRLAGLNAKRFNSELAIEKMEKMYKEILQSYSES